MPAGYFKQEKTTEARKEPVEVSCQSCSTRFRLWIPFEILPDAQDSAKISCIRCGAAHQIRKTANGFVASAVREAVVEKAHVPIEPVRTIAAPAAQAKPVAPPAPPVVHTRPDLRDTVLLIEDDRLAREMAEDAMKDTDIRFIAVRNSEEALNTIHTENIKLIVADLYLRHPGDALNLIDGEEFLKRVAGLNIPALITTGKDIIDDIVLDPKWYDLHVKDFIQKGDPFWTEKLRLKIKELLNKD
ncbi:MAG: response regulator [Deltaproteobacteria bacterium]